MRTRLAMARIKVTAPADQTENDAFHSFPFVDDMSISQPQNQKVPVDQREVAIVVAFLSLVTAVKLVAVALDDQAVADEQIDPADTRATKLRSHSDTSPPKPHANERFSSRLAERIAALDGAQVSTGQIARRHPQLR